jgi:hypothetical protein
MAIDLPPQTDIAAFIAPQELDRKRRGSRTAAIAIGTVLILSDGSECVVAGFDGQGKPLCYPVEN